MNLRAAITALLTLPLVTMAADMASPVANRAALERVYHEHRTGTKNSFEQTMPPARIKQLVQLDAHKEAVLKAIYQVEITPAMVEAEVARINATTRAPVVLAEIKAALGDDPACFSRSMARPIIVERTLRARFENDDKLHAPQRRQADAARNAALAAKPQGAAAQQEALKRFGEVHATTWKLGSVSQAISPGCGSCFPVQDEAALPQGRAGCAFFVRALHRARNVDQKHHVGNGTLVGSDLAPLDRRADEWVFGCPWAIRQGRPDGERPRTLRRLVMLWIRTCPAVTSQ